MERYEKMKKIKEIVECHRQTSATSVWIAERILEVLEKNDQQRAVKGKDKRECK